MKGKKAREMPRISDWLVIQRPEETTLVIKSKSPLKHLESEIVTSHQKLRDYLNHCEVSPAGNYFARYHSFSKKEVDFEVGFPTANQLAGKEVIIASKKQGGLYLTCIHQGPRKTIPSVYREMADWLKAHHLKTTGESEEIYLNEKTQEALLLTQILIPILEDVNGE